MGTEGEESSEAGDLGAAALLDDLCAVAPIVSKPMFGGHGVFSKGVKDRSDRASVALAIAQTAKK